MKRSLVRSALTSALVVMAIAAGTSRSAVAVSGTTAGPDARLRAALSGTGKLFGISPNGNSAGITSAVPLAAALGHSVDIVNIFVGWGEPFPVNSVAAIFAQGSVPELTVEPWRAGSGVSQPLVADARISGGAYDSYLSTFAHAAKAWGHPILLRYAHEMNGNWYPWAASVNGNTAAGYVQAWRHVHDIFVNAAAGNVLWVWCPNSGGPTPIAQVFPGSGYVDIIGMDGYNRGTPTSNWQTPASIFSGLLSTVTGLDPGVPVLINETGSAESSGNKPLWATDLFQYVGGHQSIIGVVYSEFGNWPLTSSSQVLDSAKTAIATYFPSSGTGNALATPASEPGSPSGVAGLAAGQYVIATSEGEVLGFGRSTTVMQLRPSSTVVGIAHTADRRGWWLASSDGSIVREGSAPSYGDLGTHPLNKPIVGVSPSPATAGYWLVASDGGVFNFGQAKFFGSTGNVRLNRPIVGMASTPDGRGYWLVASDGGIFDFGDAHFYGSAGDVHLNAPIVGMAGSPRGSGYWLVAADGGIFDFGGAPFYGSGASELLSGTVIGLG